MSEHSTNILFEVSQVKASRGRHKHAERELGRFLWGPVARKEASPEEHPSREAQEKMRSRSDVVVEVVFFFY